MKRHIFLTRREVQLPEWRAAFPAMEARPYAAADERLAAPGGALLWLHVDNHVKKPEALVESIRKSTPGCAVVVLSNVPRDDEGLAVLEAGAAGYTGALAVAEVLRNIETVVANGGLWVGPDLLQRLLVAMGRQAGQPPRTSSKLDKLSPREREVALAVAAGATNKEVAQKLAITERTVKAHLSEVFASLEVRDRLQLSIYINGLPQEAQARMLH
ncbi:MAG: response regulator transcription factor [Rhodocyclaceae bacterium]|nr:response regulator transcription factor [Rhodocyclaceae bacterium]